MSATAGPRGQQGRAYSPDELELRLRDALATLMADGAPFRDVTIERILTATGLARSTFYGNFPDKGAMITALSARSLQRLYAGAREWLHAGPDATREQVLAGMRLMVATYREDEVVMRAVAEAAASDPAVRTHYRSGVEDFAGAIARMIRRGVKAGRMRPVAPVATASALAWMTESAIRHADLRTAAKAEQAAEALADIVWRTLFAGEAA